MGDRYEVHEIIGYNHMTKNGILNTSICVLDREDCYREVARFNSPDRGGRAGGGGRSVYYRRARARELCDRLNAEDAQAREGTVSC